MKVIQLVNVSRRETPLYYRKEFKAEALLEFMEQRSTAPIEFTLEHKPIGGVDIRVTLVDDIDLPLMPIMSLLKKHIQELHEQGSLP